MTLTELLEIWLADGKERLKLRTQNRYRELSELHIIPQLGQQSIDRLSRREISDFLAMKKKSGNLRTGEGLSSAGVNLILNVLRSALEYACEQGLLDANPCDGIRRTREGERQIEAFTLKEQQAIEAEIERSGDLRLVGVLLCLYTGLRIGELLALRREDIDLAQGLIRVERTAYRYKDEGGRWQSHTDRPKTAAGCRTIPLPRHMIPLLRHCVSSASSEYLISNSSGGQMSTRSYQYIFKRLTESACVRPLNFHALRHTFATRAIECGIDIKTVSDILGHKNTSVTLDRYAHCMLDHKRLMMQKLPRFYK